MTTTTFGWKRSSLRVAYRSHCEGVADKQGFDEFMNLVLDDAEEVYDCSAKPGKEVKPRRELGELRSLLACARWLAGH